MNAKKIARRQRALERFSILGFEQAQLMKEEFDHPYTREDHAKYVARKEQELASLNKHHGNR